MKIKIYLNTQKQKGNLAYEYNPFHNYQTDEDLYIIDNKYVIPSGKAINLLNGEILTNKDSQNNPQWIDKRRNIISENIKTAEEGILWAKAGSLIDLDTEQLNFDLEHPVEIEVQPSYDGSVNLILNDDKNIPRLINSRFSVREKDTYEIVDRIGENDTNIYSSKTFEKDSSLYFQSEQNPTVNYLGFIKGILPVGQYCFYFTYCDADGNESDYIAETGLIPVFIGDDSNPFSMDGGIKNQSSLKGVYLKLSNIDKSYNYFKVYYVRYFADYNQNRVAECKKIYKKFPINSNIVYLQITGNEEAEDLDPNILNISRFNPKNILTQAQCKNMLFFGNIVENQDNYKELTDLALRIIPELNDITNFDYLDKDYNSNNFAYYNSQNIYSKTGYFNQEYYRFGVVFIYNNGNLSRVYNTLGGMLDSESSLNLYGELYSKNGIFLSRNYIKTDDKGWIKESDSYTFQGNHLNSKGVCLINYSNEYNDSTIFSIKFKVSEDISRHLKEELGIKGLFFVRQKCIPNIIAQCYLLPFDEVLGAPILEFKDIQGDTNKVTECFVSQYEFSHTKWERDKPFGPRIRKDIYKNGRLLIDYSSRLYKYQKESNTKAYVAICPDFNLNQAFYNQIFNASTFKLQKISEKNDKLEHKTYGRIYSEQEKTTYKIKNNYTKVIISTVTEEVPTVAIKDVTYRLTIGQAEEAFRFRYAEIDNGTYDAGDTSDYTKMDGEDGDVYDKINESTNIVRGKYSPYLAIYSESKLDTSCLYNIYSSSQSSIIQEFQIRMNSSDAFYAISDRFNLTTENRIYECFRGDCYINQFTYRLNRNFNDPSLPNNDVIIDQETWKNNYDVKDQTKWKKIFRSDVNAVQLGSWITFKVRSSMNYALRSVDHSYVSEEALMGAPRSFYPRSFLLEKGANKLPDSYLYNDAYRASLGYKCYFTLQDVNYVKDTFSNRIQYSAVLIFSEIMFLLLSIHCGLF